MTTAIYNETLAELHAMLDTLPVEDEPDLQSQIDAIDRVAPTTVKQPEIVATSIIFNRAPAQENKEDAASDALLPQCADPTLTPHPHQRSNTKTESAIPSPESAGKHPLRQETTRKPRLKSARLDEIARTKSWDGTRSLNRKDKLTDAEKFTAAVWHTKAAKGLAMSLNLGIRREGMLLYHEDPHRRMMQNLHRDLSAAGFKELPYAVVFEIPPEKDLGRLHLHGVIDTSGLSPDDLPRLEDALRKAASESFGAIGGERQLVLKDLNDAPGWADYILKSVTSTAQELRIDREKTLMINQPMRRAAKSFFETLRAEELERLPAPARRRKVALAPAKQRENGRGRFTSSARSGIVLTSGERDKRSADRVLVRASCRRPTLNIGQMKPLQSSATKHRLCA